MYYYPDIHVCLRKTMALTQKQHETVSENKWIRRTMGVKRAAKRRMEELRVDVGVKESIKNQLVRSRLKWPEHVERMGD